MKSKMSTFFALVACLFFLSALAFGGAAGESAGKTKLPEEPKGKFLQPNPLWGIGIKPDGTPYKFLQKRQIDF